MNDKTPLRELKGVGDKTEKLFQKIGITTTEELLRYYPRTYDVYEEPVEIASAEEEKTVSIRGTITGSLYSNQVRNLQILTTTVADQSGRLPVAWFNAPYLKGTLKKGSVFIFRGKIIRKKGRLQMEHPEIFTPAAYEEVVHSMQPVYALTKGLTNKAITKLVRQVLDTRPLKTEYLPEEIRERYQLADDNFATIVGAVEEGRRIYDNIRKAIQFLLGSNMSEVLSIFFATLLGFTILQPVHLLWINLVTDCFPALALGTEKAEPNIMKRKPRDAKAGIFADGMGFDIAYQGLLVTALVMVSYFIGHFMETGEWTITNSAHGTTMAFVTMSMAEIFHSMNMRSQRGSIFKLGSKNWLLLGAAVVSLLATTAVCEIPLLAGAFGFTSVEPAEYLVALLLSVLVVPIVELVKWIQRRSAKHED